MHLYSQAETILEVCSDRDETEKVLIEFAAKLVHMLGICRGANDGVH